MDCSPSGSSIHGILQARVLEWGAIAFSAITHRFEISFIISRSRQKMDYQCLILKFCFVYSFLRVKCELGLSRPQVKVIGRNGKKNLPLLKWKYKYFGIDESHLFPNDLEWASSRKEDENPTPFLIVLWSNPTGKVNLFQTPGICIQIRQAFPEVNFYCLSQICYFTEEKISANFSSTYTSWYLPLLGNLCLWKISWKSRITFVSK